MDILVAFFVATGLNAVIVAFLRNECVPLLVEI